MYVLINQKKKKKKQVGNRKHLRKTRDTFIASLVGSVECSGSVV